MVFYTHKFSHRINSFIYNFGKVHQHSSVFIILKFKADFPGTGKCVKTKEMGGRERKKADIFKPFSSSREPMGYRNLFQHEIVSGKKEMVQRGPIHEIEWFAHHRPLSCNVSRPMIIDQNS